MIQSIEQGRKEDGNRSIADKIIKRLHDLDKTVQHNFGRWAWELLQNAKDSVVRENRPVNVKIEYHGDKVVFSHNGRHFTEKDIRGLINQISSKEVEEGEDAIQTGRFGTGFLTTHLLSKVVGIKGIIESAEGDLYTFNFPLDRTGSTTQALIPKIEEAWSAFHRSTENGFIENYEEEDFNTSFTYLLTTQKQVHIADTGINEFSKLIPYVLAFIPKIGTVEIIDTSADETVVFENADEIEDGFKIIKKTVDGNKTKIRLLYATDGEVSIAARAIKKEGFYYLQALDTIPKIFCDFPLIGTEDFHFPVVINSFFFNPLTERDGIWLKGDGDDEVAENRRLLESGMSLFKEMVNALNCDSYKQIYHIANTSMPEMDERYFERNWYSKSIQEEIRKHLLDAKIVEIPDGSGQKLSGIWFPQKSASDADREKLWQYTFDMYPGSVCSKDDLQGWMDVIWEDMHKITPAVIAADIASEKNVKDLSAYFQEDESETLKWLNTIGKFLWTEESNSTIVDTNAIIPNRYGIFQKKSQLYIDHVKDNTLVEILRLLGEDWNALLLHKSVAFGWYNTKEKKEIAQLITEKLKKPDNRNPDHIKAISLMSEWFDDNPEEGKDLFSDVYRRKAELFMNTIQDKDSLYKVMRSGTDLSKVAEAIEANPRLFENLDQAEQLYAMLKQFNVDDLDQLRDLLENGKRSVSSPGDLLPVTQEILTNMGITSIEEWQEAIKDKNLAQLFSHESTPSTDMFLYVQSLIQQAKQKIIDHLDTLEEYDLALLDDSTAPTILAGIYKDGRPISIVARPAYNGQVIIYYGSERDILDYEPSELWIHDGNKPRIITLGHLLKTGNIVKFPV